MFSIQFSVFRREDRGSCRIGDGHLTFSANLVRTADIPKIFPARNELDAERNFMRHFELVAQLVPGCFHHLAEDESASLRRKTRNPLQLTVLERAEARVPRRVRNWASRNRRIRRLLGRPN